MFFRKKSMQGKLQFQVKPRNQNANSLKFFNKVTSPELTLVQAYAKLRSILALMLGARGAKECGNLKIPND